MAAGFHLGVERTHQLIVNGHGHALPGGTLQLFLLENLTADAIFYKDGELSSAIFTLLL